MMRKSCSLARRKISILRSRGMQRPVGLDGPGCAPIGIASGKVGQRWEDLKKEELGAGGVGQGEGVFEGVRGEPVPVAPHRHQLHAHRLQLQSKLPLSPILKGAGDATPARVPG